MPPANRHQPTRTACSDSQFSLMEFMRQFPDDAACLEHLWRTRWSPDGEHADCPKCDQVRVFKRYATTQGRQSWTCTGCGHHVHPTAGTIFQGSSTSLHLWYYAMYLMASTRCGISAKHLERELGVAYRTAWRMLNKIRNELMKQDDVPLSGDVEADETWVGGKPRAYETRTRGKGGASREHLERKTAVFGMVERGGRIKVNVHQYRTASGLVRKAIYENVLPRSMIFTDEWTGYKGNALSSRYIAHKRIRHNERIYVDGDVHTQTIEGFFGLMKNSIRGTHHAVSTKWLQSYLNEYAWRYNERSNTTRSMFETLLANAAAR